MAELERPQGWTARERAVRIAGVVLLAILALFAIRGLELALVREALTRARPWPLVLAMLANLAAVWAQSLRWHALVHPAAPQARPRDAFRATITAFAVGLVMPARLADVAKVQLLSSRSGASRAALAATVLLDTVVGVATLILLLGLYGLVAPLPAWARSAAFVALLVTAGSFAAVFILRPRQNGAVPTTGSFAAILVAKARSGLLAAGRPRALVLSGLAGVAGWAMEVAIAILTLSAFGMPPTLHLGALVTLATTLSSAVSISPGNAGVFEASVVLALGGIGVSRELALAFALGYHAVHVVPVALAGGVFAVLATRGDRG